MEITNLQKKLIILLSILVGIMVSITFSLYRAIYVNPNNLNVIYQTLQDEAIPTSLNDVSILYFTDLEFGEFQNQERTENLFNTIYDLAPDVVIFGGDLYDSSDQINDENNQLLINYLSKIDAPLGKFAVLGEKDQLDETMLNTINNIYSNSQFETLSDINVKIGNQSTASIRLIGLSSQPNFEQALSNLSSDEYNLLVSHYPDTLVNETLASYPISLALAGHSHGTQVTYPIIGGYRSIENATQLNRSISRNLSFDYIISSGVGCTNVNVRLLSTPEIYYFNLHH